LSENNYLLTQSTDKLEKKRRIITLESVREEIYTMAAVQKGRSVDGKIDEDFNAALS
jgi:hypothetical protein